MLSGCKYACVYDIAKCHISVQMWSTRRSLSLLVCFPTAARNVFFTDPNGERQHFWCLERRSLTHIVRNIDHRLPHTGGGHTVIVDRGNTFHIYTCSNLVYHLRYFSHARIDLSMHTRCWSYTLVPGSLHTYLTAIMQLNGGSI